MEIRGKRVVLKTLEESQLNYLNEVVFRYCDDALLVPQRDTSFGIWNEHFIGVIILDKRKENFVSYWIDSIYRGNGYAKEALSCVCQYADLLGMTLVADVSSRNIASQKVLISNNFYFDSDLDNNPSVLRYVRD